MKQMKKKKKVKDKKNAAPQYSHVVPDRTTDWAVRWLTLQIGQDAVFSASQSHFLSSVFVALPKVCLLLLGASSSNCETRRCAQYRSVRCSLFRCADIHPSKCSSFAFEERSGISISCVSTRIDGNFRRIVVKRNFFCFARVREGPFPSSLLFSSLLFSFARSGSFGLLAADL
jgi:hypothetical protein